MPSRDVLQGELQVALSDRYELRGEIGRGGMATVFRAYDSRFERDVASKVLRADLAAVVGSERFRREIQIAARLKHPHILIKEYSSLKPEHRQRLAESQSCWWRELRTDPRFRELIGASR
jgi:serine/threonine protein kinase